MLSAGLLTRLLAVKAWQPLSSQVGCFRKQCLAHAGFSGSRTLSSSRVCAVASSSIITKNVRPSEVKKQGMDESRFESVNVDALHDAIEDTSTTSFQTIPDDRIYDASFNGVKFVDLPIVTIQCRPNNTKLTVHDGQGKKILYGSPRMFGFVNAAKRTAVAGQATGLNVGQKLRNMNLRTVRVRIDGFNNGRIAAVQGLVAAGIKVVSLSDITLIEWTWVLRAQKPKRQ